MSDALLRPNYLQNSDVFQELISSQIGDNINPTEMEPKHPNVAVYLRVSSKDQTIQSQLSTLRPFLLVEGYDVAECSLYIDDGVSAKSNPNFHDRPNGSKMMKDVADGKISTIYGFKVNRFFRRVAEGAVWMDLMADKYN
ncbi:unnamed protein product, partial [marine sediment metagenome]